MKKLVNIMSECKSIILTFIVIALIIYFVTPKNVARKITPTEGFVPMVYEVNTGTSYYYSVWVLPNGEKTVYLCHQEGTSQTSTFGMAPAVHPDGTPATPEELGIAIPEDANTSTGQ